MNRKPNDTTLAAMILFAAAALIMIVVALTNRGDITSATLVLGSVSAFIAGIFLLTFAKEEPLDLRFTTLLPVQGTLDIARMCADLGMQGNAHMVPAGDEIANPSVTQVIPVSEYRPLAPADGYSFVTGRNGNGVVITPLGYPLLRMLEESSDLRLPGDEEEALAAIKEVCEEVLEVAGRVDAERAGDSIVVELSEFRLLQGCLAVRKESPKACLICPCPVCSLIACMLAKGTGRTCTIEQATVEPGSETLRLILSVVP